VGFVAFVALYAVRVRRVSGVAPSG
jgi:hypothetical protein